MFSKMKIGHRLLLLISALTIVFFSTGSITLLGLNSASESSEELNQKVAEGVVLTQIASIVRAGYVKASSDLYLGSTTWKDATRNIKQGKYSFNAAWEKYLINLNTQNKELTNDLFSEPVNNLTEGFDSLLEIVQQENRGLLTLFMLNDSTPLSSPFLNAVEASLYLQQEISTELIERATIESNQYLLISLIMVISGLLVAIILGFLVYRSITNPISKIAVTIADQANGNMDARTNVRGVDELGHLGLAFDALLNERMNTLEKAERENEQLNDSIIELLEATAQLSERDLTVKVPVAEDVTGPVADAMNMMAEETSRVLKTIHEISVEVERAAHTVNDQGQHVSQVAAKERLIVEATMRKLDEASNTMNQIAKLAQNCNIIATKASNSTSEALNSVTNTTVGMNDIRETISETEKRIKRLGERSQEITGVVSIINNIAERTHVLALNASMQAAAAGEAGRGFAVVADEVQRLAEASRQSTAEIQLLVSNIQTETAETMSTMNKTITQVIDGTKLAHRSGEQMQATQKTTHDLAIAVEKIAQHSLAQAKVSNALRSQVTEIVGSTAETSKELEEQSKQTASLLDFSDQLLKSVRIFKLPA
ncbi:type IV pilus biogenesis protein PilJ [hydrothermal vent metagenome]|uniref:Type IV pilus biogenesis protein PilJ n=1 Tax=hydrothermal vent metagenome TaxID=652676 RepID=A0A3B0ZF27_9ZZZZ